MIERMFSPRGFKIYFFSNLGLVCYVLWLRFTNSGIIAWMDQFQARYLFSGTHSHELSVVILFFPILFVSFAIGFLYDFLTGQGIFSGRNYDNDETTPEDSRWEIEYQGTMRKELIDQVRAKHRARIDQLKSLGFVELCFYSETVPWFGMTIGPLGLLGALAVLSNEVALIGKNLSVKGYYPGLFSWEYSTYASVSQLGVNLYTSFTDGTHLISSNYAGIEILDDKQKLYKISRPRSIQTMWANHQQQVNEFHAEGKQTLERVDLAAYLALIKQVNDYMVKNPSKIGGASTSKPSFLVTLATSIISTIVSMGILLGCVALLMFLGNLVGSFYPACWFVRNLRVISLPLNFGAIFACLAVSWGLARIQNNLFTVNGIGVQLYGRDPAPNSQGYISTKWLVLPWIPLIPVRSYLVTGERTDAMSNEKIYILQPLKKMNWVQVRVTLRKSRVAYGILLLGVIAFTLWSIFECR